MPSILIIIIEIILLGGGLRWARSGYAGGPFLGGGIRLVLLVLVILFLFSGGMHF